MRFEDEVLIRSSAGAVWAIYSDVERWPEWTASVRAVRFVEGEALAVGARVRIEQPKLRPAVWEVAALEPGGSWTWVSRAPGIRTTAVHTLEPIEANQTRVRQTLTFGGPLGGILGRAYARLTRSYLAIEAEGLKQRCEANASR